MASIAQTPPLFPLTAAGSAAPAASASAPAPAALTPEQEYLAERNEPVGRVLSMGAGVNSVALLLHHADLYSHAIFSDTGNERPETYRYIEDHVKPFCAKHGIEFVTVRHKSGLSLEEHSRNKKQIPIRHLRWCTTEFKRRPIKKYMRYTLGATRAAPIQIDIAIAYDESHRARFAAKGDDPLYMIRKYPLVDEHIGRDACLAIIKQHRLPPPVKSGCDFCFNRPIGEFRDMAVNNPARLREIASLEQNGADYPKTTFKGFPLADLLRPDSATLAAYLAGADDSAGMCEDGYCMS